MLATLVALALCLAADEAPPSNFTVTIPRALDAVHVEAKFAVSTPYLEIDEGAYSQGVEGGLAAFVENLVVSRADGSPLSVEGPKDGRWRIEAQAGDAITVRYDIRLAHGDKRWPFGADQISSVRDGSLVFVSHTVFIFNDSVRESRVRFVLPEGWRVATPWRPLEGEAHSYRVANRLLLLECCVMLGDFIDREVRSGDTVVRLAMGREFGPYSDTLENAIRGSVSAYTELFRDTPRARFLAVVNAGGITDGSAYPNSVNLLTPQHMEGANFVQAVYTLSHEILHLWNGYRLRPAGQMEWFREGVTDYLTWRTLAGLKLLSEEAQLTELRRQIYAYVNLDRKISLADTGDDRFKNKNKVLVYDGGSLAALCLDAALRERTKGAAGFREFVRELYARSAKRDVPYDDALIAAVASEIAGEDFAFFFDRYIKGMEPLPLEEALAAFGLRLKTAPEKPGDRVSVTVEAMKSVRGEVAQARDALLGR